MFMNLVYTDEKVIDSSDQYKQGYFHSSASFSVFSFCPGFQF
jgi:hypothetical protein